MAGKRKARPTPTPPPRPSWLSHLQQGLALLATRFITHLILPILLPVLIVGFGLLALHLLQSSLRERSGPVKTLFRSIDCAAPAGLTRLEFLENVQAYANIPDELDMLDDHLATRLKKAFASDPWVERVERITPTPQGLRVELTFRVPVLAVPVDATGKFRAVDARGVLLPEKANRAGLPQFAQRPRLDPTRPGTVWADSRLTAAAPVAGWLAPHQDRLRVEKVDVGERGVLLMTAWNQTIIWGSPPGAERQGEPAAAQKLERLLQPLSPNGTLDLTQ